MSGQIFELSTPFSLFNSVVVLDGDDKHITFGLLETSDESVKERLQKAADLFFGVDGGTCRFVTITKDEFDRVVSRQYGERGDSALDAYAVKRKAAETEMYAAVMLLDSLLSDARKRGATDIHIEETRVRFRISGKLVWVCDLAALRSRELVRRIKMLARLDVLETRMAQDGHFVVQQQSDEKKVPPLFVRVSCMPALSADGDGACESVVLRLLDSARVPLNFTLLGFSEKQCAMLREFSQLTSGLVLICGATGAGKSTTAAALLAEMSCAPHRKIITIEEPPEYVLPGVIQIAVHEQAGIDFETALAFVFRQDPDVILIGEIRDEKSARTALQAAMTGHLVFATIHTDDFYVSLLRLQQLGADKKQIAAVLRGIIVQELHHTATTVSLCARILRLHERNAWNFCMTEKSEERRQIIEEVIV